MKGGVSKQLICYPRLQADVLVSAQLLHKNIWQGSSRARGGAKKKPCQTGP